jgi:uncharacterized protein
MAPSEPTAEQLIARFGLEPHPEGGWYRELHRSQVEVQRAGDGQRRAGLTVIVFLLRRGERSRWHRVSGADEVWHHGAGALLELRLLPPQGGQEEGRRLGPLDAGDPTPQPLQIVPAGWWQAARSLGSWSLVYCCVGPGFDFADFDLMAELPVADRPPGADPLFLT